MDMSKYLDLFISESREHLEEAAEAIAKLEEKPDDQELLNVLFRHGHSIKGMAASMGYDPIAKVSHALEDRFDDIRKGEAKFTSALAEKALAAVDAISDALDGLERGEDPPAELLALAERVRETDPDSGPSESGTPEDGAPPPPSSAPPDSFPPPPSGAAAAAGDGVIFNVEITLLPSVPMPAARALVLYKKLESLGKILFASPDKATISLGKFTGRLLVQFSSTGAEDRMRADLESIPEVQSVVLAPFRAPEEPATPAPGKPPTAAAPAPKAAAPGPTIRIQTDSLDRFLDHLGELIIHGSRLENSLFPAPEGKTADALDAMRKALERLRADLMRLRMIPFEHIASRFVRSVRNLGGNLGKRVTLSIHGREVRLDRSILEDLVDPINHILRNAVDHGIESPEERAATGKDKVGRINIRNTSYSDSVTIEIEDDGRGMDVDRIRRAAIERQFITAEEARSLNEAETLMLVTTPGFSTAERLTEISGRGVGMDVVRTRIESLGGRLRITSQPGEGTRILLHLPLTVAVIHAFLVRSGEGVYAVPVSRVRRTFEVVPDQVRHLGSSPILRLGEETIELVFLGEVMEDGGPVRDGNGNGDGSHPALLYFRDERPMGLVVDAVLAKRDIVVKPLRSPLENLREFSGATILEDGRIALILDVHNLSRAAG